MTQHFAGPRDVVVTGKDVPPGTGQVQPYPTEPYITLQNPTEPYITLQNPT